MSDELKIMVRNEHIIVRRGRKSILCLSAVDAGELGGALVLASESITATAPWISTDRGTQR